MVHQVWELMKLVTWEPGHDCLRSSECLFDLDETGFIPPLTSSLRSCVVLPQQFPLVSFLRALMKSRTSKTTIPVGTTQYLSATPLTMDVSEFFINSDLEATPPSGWRATSGKGEAGAELSPSRQCAPMFSRP